MARHRRPRRNGHRKIVDTRAQVAAAIKALYQLPGLTSFPPQLHVDLEGIDLGRSGSISLLQIYAWETDTTYIFDIYKLGRAAFETPGRKGCTLKTLLMDRNIPKVMFDCRVDNDALYNLFDVDMDGIEDVQLMEIVARSNARKQYLNGLSTVVQQHADFSRAEFDHWIQVKNYGKVMFAGGDYSELETRPLDKRLIEYCIQDVTVLADLWEYFNDIISDERAAKWQNKIDCEVQNRLKMAHASTWPGTTDPAFMALAPAGWWKYHPVQMISAEQILPQTCRDSPNPKDTTGIVARFFTFLMTCLVSSKDRRED